MVEKERGKDISVRSKREVYDLVEKVGGNVHEIKIVRKGINTGRCTLTPKRLIHTIE